MSNMVLNKKKTIIIILEILTINKNKLLTIHLNIFFCCKLSYNVLQKISNIIYFK